MWISTVYLRVQKSDLVIVAGRPIHGQDLLRHEPGRARGAGQPIPVLVFSMEMPAEQLMMRMLSSLGRIDQTLVRTGRLDQGGWEKLSKPWAS
jgi:replicative DNA helicase